MYRLIYGIGQIIDKILLVVAVIATILWIAGLIIDATWTANAGWTLFYSLSYSIWWFFTSLLFVYPKVKEERAEIIKQKHKETFGDSGDKS
jgi:hypothetical protein